MKKTLIILSVFSLCFACNNRPEVTRDPLEGVWLNTKNYDISPTDTTLDKGRNEHKIYYKGYFMWNAEPNGTNEEHGFGTYKLENDSLTETLLVCSASMKQSINEIGTNEFKIWINIEKNSFDQMLKYKINDTTYYRHEYYSRLK